jgi:hypothetical protein
MHAHLNANKCANIRLHLYLCRNKLLVPTCRSDRTIVIIPFILFLTDVYAFVLQINCVNTVTVVGTSRNLM